MADGNDDGLVAACAHILLSPACQNIGFHWLGQFISGKGYRSVVVALMDSDIELVMKPLTDEGGVYSARKDRLTLDSPFSPGDFYTQMTIVHEATHAIQDIDLAGQWLMRIDLEAAAYVAEWIFCLNSSPANGPLRYEPDLTDAIDVQSLAIARAVAANPKADIDADLIKKLRDAIYANPLYSAQMVLHPWERQDGV